MSKKLTDIKLLTCLLILVAIFFSSNAVAQANEEEKAMIEIQPPIVDSIVSYTEDEFESEDAETTDFTSVNDFAADTVKQNHLQAGYIDSLKNDKNFAYVKTGIPRPKARSASGNNSFTLNKILLYISIIAFIGFLIWYLINNNIILFKNKSAALKENVGDEEVSEDIFSIQYKQAIQKALQNKNYRLAIRLHYLQLLKMMADKKIITYRPDKTNFDYLMQLRPTDHYNDFFSVTRNYEYSWYGLFDISEQQYQKMEQGFENFYKRVK